MGKPRIRECFIEHQNFRDSGYLGTGVYCFRSKKFALKAKRDEEKIYEIKTDSFKFFTPSHMDIFIIFCKAVLIAINNKLKKKS